MIRAVRSDNGKLIAWQTEAQIVPIRHLPYKSAASHQGLPVAWASAALIYTDDATTFANEATGATERLVIGEAQDAGKRDTISCAIARASPNGMPVGAIAVTRMSRGPSLV